MDFIGKLTVYEPVIKEFESILNSWLSTPIIILGGAGDPGFKQGVGDPDSIGADSRKKKKLNLKM